MFSGGLPTNTRSHSGSPDRGDRGRGDDGPREAQKRASNDQKGIDFCLLATFRVLFQRMNWVELTDVVQVPVKQSMPGGARINTQVEKSPWASGMNMGRTEHQEPTQRSVSLFTINQSLRRELHRWWKMGGLPTSYKSIAYRSVMSCVSSVSHV